MGQLFSSLFWALDVLNSGDFISGWGERLSEAHCAEHIDDSLEVVSHDGDANFSLSTCQSAQKQARVAEDTVFDCPEGMLYRRSP